MKRRLSIMLAIALVTLIGIAIGQAAKDDRFVVHKTNETVLDTKTNLMWAAKDNGSDISWTNAKAYCENFTAGGYKDWRMPTADELASLYEANQTRKAPCSGNFQIHVVTDSIEVTCFAVWTSETRSSDATQFSFVYGTPSPYLQSHTYATRVLPVRSHK